MPKKSKTQRAKASARRAEKKVTAKTAEVVEEVEAAAEEEKKKGGKLFSRKEKVEEVAPPVKSSGKSVVKAEKKGGVIARLASFIKDVRAELRRVTWPTRTDVLRWSGVVAVALVFFSLYVFVLDNWVVTPLLLAISSLGA
jgi:preprotein translocase subunit SecE